MQTFHAAFLFTGLLHLAWLPLGHMDSNTDESDTFRLEDYTHWLENHKINLVNYVAEVGTRALILSPITPAPISIRWFSLKLNDELPRRAGKVSATTSRYFEEFQKTYNVSWQNVYKYDEIIRWLKIQNVRLGYADVFRVFVEDSRADTLRNDTQTIDVAITLMIFEKHECGFTSRPQNPKKGDSLNMSCSVIVNGLWNASLIFRNDYDESEITGIMSECDSQPSIGTKICSTVEVTADADILAFSCRLKFSPSERHDAKPSLFQNSTWTAEFNKEISCTLPKIYLEVIPSDVSFLCNQMPCGDTASVNDTVTCVDHGYPQPVFDLRIKKLSPGPTPKVVYENRFFLDTTDEYGSLALEINGGYGLGEPSSPLNCVEVKGDKDWFDCSSEETNLPGWCESRPLDGENVAGKMQSSLFSVDEHAKGHFDLLFTSSEMTSGGYGCESVDATHTAEVAVLGVIMMLILFIIGTMKSTDQRRNTSSRKYPYGNTSCPSRSLLWIAFVLCSIAVSPESVDGWLIESRDMIALLGDRVELDCITNSSQPVEWSFSREGSGKDESLAVNGQLRSNISNVYSIVNNEFGRTTLVIDPVHPALAGTYECLDPFDQYDLYVQVTVVDPFPVCDQSRESSSIVCRFLYTGKLIPDFDWLPSENIAFCNESVDESLTIGSVRMKSHNNSAGHWRCKPQKDDGQSLGKLPSPLNYAAVKGESVRLNCSKKKDDTGFWFRNAPLSADEILIYHKKLTRNGWFSIDESVPGRSDLLFTSWDKTSGRYGRDSVDATHTAEVIALDVQPSCSWETKTGVVNASCSIGFSGNWPPVIDWYNPIGRVEASYTSTIPSQRVTSFLIVPLTGDPQERYIVTCSIKFRIEDKPPETTATNIPEMTPNFCRVTIEAPDPGSAASNKGVPKLNDGMAAEKSDAFSELVGEYWQTESHYRIVLLEDRVEMDCFVNTSHPLEWYFKPYGSNVSEFINVSSQADSNVTYAYRIVGEDSDHATLIIDRVLLTDAGRYECHDTDGQYKLSVEVTVVDPNPTCNQSTESSSIVCPFRYAGNVAPDFKWSTSENATFCSEFGNDSSAIASLLIKNYKSPAGRWRCKPPKNDALTGPLNYGAVKGELVRLNCSKREDDTGYWFLNAPLSADEILIYHRRKTSKNIWFPTNESDPIRSDLLFTASESTSGRYGCDSFGATHTAEVIVSDSKPSCSWETKTGFVNASCSIGFSGNWPPVIDWYNPMGKVEANATTIPSHSVSSFLTLPLTDDPHELYYVTCSVKFRIEDKPPETTATNIPENHRFCQLKVGEKEEEHGDAAGAIDVDQAENIEHGDAAGAIDVDQAENIDPGPAAGNKGAPKWNDGTAENDKPKPSIGSGRESFVLLQLFLAFIAAFVGFGQF